MVARERLAALLATMAATPLFLQAVQDLRSMMMPDGTGQCFTRPESKGTAGGYFGQCAEAQVGSSSGALRASKADILSHIEHASMQAHRLGSIGSTLPADVQSAADWVVEHKDDDIPALRRARVATIQHIADSLHEWTAEIRDLAPPYVRAMQAYRPHLAFLYAVIQAAAIAVYTSLPWLVRGRPVLHFIDNTGALSLLVHGYSSRPDCARLVNVFHLLHARLHFLVWFEWVPSAANIADLPSRGAYTEFYSYYPHSVAVPFVLPPFGTFMGPLADFVGAMGL